MALPTLNDVSAVSPLLQNMLVAYAQDETRFAALRAFPAVSVPEKSGTYYKFDKKYWFVDGLKPRAPGDDFAVGGFGVSTDTYATSQWARAFRIADEERDANQPPMALEQAAVRWLAQQSFIRKERAFSADFMQTGVWGTDGTPTDWDDASGVPITDCLTARRTVGQATGQTPNTILMGEIVYDALLVNAQVISAMQYTQTMTVDTRRALLAAVLGFDTLLVSTAVYNSANEGQAASLAAIIDDDALVYYNDPGATMMSATAGKTFVWNPGGGAGAQNTARVDTNDADLIKHKEQWDQKLVSSDLGYFFPGIV